MGDIAHRIDEVIRIGLSGLLRAHGFKRSGRRWHKVVGEDWQIVNVQVGSANTGDAGSFAVSLGVFVAPVAAMAGQKRPVGRPREYDATVRTRLGVLTYGSDHWWAIGPDSDLGAISTDLVEKMRSFGLPWLEAHLDIANVSAALGDSPSLLSASAAWLAGGRDEATQRLRSAIASRPAAEAHFRAWAMKNGIAP